jgi:hypothetical protein
MSLTHCELQNGLHKTDSLSLTQSGAFPKLLKKTLQMRASAQSLVNQDSVNTNQKLFNALELIDRTVGPKTIVINSSTLGSKVMQQSLAVNIDHVKIAAENHSAAFSTTLGLELLTMKKLIGNSLKTVQ